jgi:hypothetical protein
MRHGPAGRRLRNRGGGGGNNNHGRRGGGGGNNRNQVFDSNGPDVRIRGTAHQIQEKYATLAKDSAAAGDRILAESYLQHAEHYQRIINSWIEQSGQNQSWAHEAEDTDDESNGDTRFDVRPRQQHPQQQRPDLGLPASITGEVQPRQTELADA